MLDLKYDNLSSTQRGNDGCLGGGCDVYLSLFLDHVKIPKLIPRYVFCMVE